MPVLEPQEIADLRTAGHKWLEVMQEIKRHVRVGTNLLDLERTASDMCKKLGVIPSFKGYNGYPAATCLSVNDEVVHCIPKDYTLSEGDVITVDFGVYFRGLHVDGAVTWGVGSISAPAKQLLAGTYRALLAGTNAVRAGAKVSEISAEIEKVLKAKNFVIFKQFVGHGVGRNLHEEPMIPNYAHPGPSPTLKANMALAIEPITGLGTDATVLDEANGWDTRTKSGQIACEFEHTVVVTDTGFEVITPLETLIDGTK